MIDHAKLGTCEAFNLGTDETTDVNESIGRVLEHMQITPTITYTGDQRGWIGDSPLIHLDCAKLRALGWVPESTISEAVARTLSWFDDNGWVFERAGG